MLSFFFFFYRGSFIIKRKVGIPLLGVDCIRATVIFGSSDLNGASIDGMWMGSSTGDHVVIFSAILTRYVLWS